ncbi:hypothetical protein B0H19DRAFT_1070255 [Mycena capillaripes]|nr:hypothetical protein B0H19DRAFT_1070255 [Mycena capillaripes]
MAKGGKSKKKQTDGVKYDASSFMPCPDCLEMIHVATGGPSNLVNHKPACKGRPKGKNRKISEIFTPKSRASLVPSTVSSAPPLIPSTASGNKNYASFASSPLRQSSPYANLTSLGSDDSSFLDCGASDALHAADTGISVHGGTAGKVPIAASSEPGYDALYHLRLKVEQIPLHISGDPLVTFAGNPADFFGSSEPQDRDKIIHNLLARNFGCSSWAYSMGAPSLGVGFAPRLESGHGDGAGDDAVGGSGHDGESLVSNAPQETARESADMEKDATAHAPIVKFPNPVPTDPQSIQEKPSETTDEQALPVKRARRTTKYLNIGGCDTYDQVISEVEKRDRSLVAECTKKA